MTVCCAVCSPVSYTHLDVYKRQKQNLIGAGNNVVTVQLNQDGYAYDMSWNSIPDGVRTISQDTKKQLLDVSGVEKVSLYTLSLIHIFSAC